jgi:sugar/nucleoside kinase (ribokinase family)
MAFDVVTVGNYTQDTIVSPAGTRRVDGGGFAYAAHAARVAGLAVAAVTRLARRDMAVLEPLRAAGVQVFAHESPQSTRLRLEYPGANVDERIVSVTDVADPLAAAHVASLEARAIVVNASLRGEVEVEVLRAARGTARTLALDVQGFLRVIAPDGRLLAQPWPEKDAVLAMVDVLKTDAVEAEFLTGTSDLCAAARALAALGPREIVLTHAEGVLVLAGDAFHAAPFRPRMLRGRSGRGDTCIGAYVSMRLSAPPDQATRWAAAVTSLKLEAEGPIQRSAADVRALLDASG